MEPTEVIETESTVEVDVMASQGIEGPTDAELRGEDVEETETEPTETKTEVEETKTEETTEETSEEESTEAKKEEETKEEELVTEEETASSEPETKETPKGFVPLEAVHQARGEIKYLKEQLQTLQTQVQTLQVKPEETKETDFEVLTDVEFEDLADDNPAQAAIYLRKLSVHEASQRDAADVVKQQADFAKEYDSIIDASVAEIEKVVPGIFDEDSKVKTELMEYANNLGFTEDLYYLTNPSTKIILPGESEPLLLGEQAATILGMLVNAKAKTVVPDNTALETKLRTEITAELMKKFKTPTTEEYRSLTQVPKVEGETPESDTLTGKVLSTDQLSKLSDAEQETYLAGN